MRAVDYDLHHQLFPFVFINRPDLVQHVSAEDQISISKLVLFHGLKITSLLNCSRTSKVLIQFQRVSFDIQYIHCVLIIFARVDFLSFALVLQKQINHFFAQIEQISFARASSFSLFWCNL